MRAVLFSGPDRLDVVDVPEPELPDGGLVVSTAYVGVCGSDVRTWHHGSARLSGPTVLGHEVVGVVAASADGRYAVGDRVAVCPGAPCLTCANCLVGAYNMCGQRVVLGYDISGGMAERFAVPRRSIDAGCVVPVPDSLDLRSAVLAEPLHTVLNGQNRAGIGPDDTVLVLGLGTIGTLHTAVALSRGARRVLGVDVRPERVEAAEVVLGPGHTAVLDMDVDDLRARGGVAGWDVVVLAAGVGPAVETANAVVAPNGRVLVFAGFPSSSPEYAIDLNRLHYKQHALIGAFGGTPVTYGRAVEWLAATSIDLDAFVGDVFPIDDALAAFANVESGRGLKTVMQP
jgi:L-iditol 2-dehydrogenase